jgi:hypothetical protein
MQVISASRRTDIPAFYSEWFMNRVRAKYVRWPNPYGGRPYAVSLDPEDVSAIVSWSKNYGPMLSHLPELDTRGYHLLFHFTITGLPRAIEPAVPDFEVAVQQAGTLSKGYGPEAVQWRYDPIYLSRDTDSSYHVNRFATLASKLEGVVKRCYISFPTMYRKVARNTAGVGSMTMCDPSVPERIDLAGRLALRALEHGIQLLTCCGEYLVSELIGRAHCIDEEILKGLYPDSVGKMKAMPTRRECGCFESRDIGAYDTCPHGCTYCYANARRQTALDNHGMHNPDSDMVCGESGLGDLLVIDRRISPKRSQLQLPLGI